MDSPISEDAVYNMAFRQSTRDNEGPNMADDEDDEMSFEHMIAIKNVIEKSDTEEVTPCDIANVKCNEDCTDFDCMIECDNIRIECEHFSLLQVSSSTECEWEYSYCDDGCDTEECRDECLAEYEVCLE